EPFGTPCLPRMRADLLDLRRERVGRSTQCLEAERTRNIDRVDRTLGGEQRQDADAGVRLCPVVECEPFLRLENQWRQAEASERIRTAHPLALDPRLAFAHQYECEMRQWCEVPARTDTATRRDDRCDRVVQQVEQSLDDDGTDTGVTECEHVCAQQRDCA